MKSPKKYMELIKKYPSLFENPAGSDTIRIFTDPDEIEFHRKQIREKNIQKGVPSSWSDIGILVDDPWYWVVRDLVEFPGGHIAGYIRFINRKDLEGGTSVVILPVQQGKIVLISHFRHETRRAHWELPSGFGERGLDPRQNALKELQEELGVTPIQLSEMSREIECSDSDFAYYYAELHPAGKIHVETAEGIGSYALLTPLEFEEWLRDGKITSGNAVKAYLLAGINGFLPRIGTSLEKK